MEAASLFFWSHPLWVWLAVGAAFLAVEAASGSGWLLWPAGSAGAAGVATLVAPMSFPAQVAVFAALTIVTTLVGRRYLRPAPAGASDINDALTRLVGHQGAAAADFVGGRGRVFVDGKEWSAQADAEGVIAAGDKVEVVAVVGGARLEVRPL